MDDEIANREAMHGPGRVDWASRSSARASCADAARREFEALRELDMSGYLIRRLLSRMGAGFESYRGFGAIEHSMKSVGTKLDELAHDDPELLATRSIDRLVRKEDAAPQVGPGALRPGSSRGMDLAVALARRDVEHGDFSAARRGLEETARGAQLSAEAEALLAQVMWRTGDRHAALEHASLSLLKLVDRSGPDYGVLFATYHGRRLVQHNGDFYAVRAVQDSYVEQADDQVRLVQHRSPSWLRQWLRRHLPRSMSQWLRRIAAQIFLVREMRLEGAARAADLGALLDLIDRDVHGTKGGVDSLAPRWSFARNWRRR